MKTLVLDAMGVIYQAGDDVVELLCPFIHQHGGVADDREIEALYIEASLGHLSARQFWEKVQVDPNLEDDYLRRHRLSTGLREFLRGTLKGCLHLVFIERCFRVVAKAARVV